MNDELSFNDNIQWKPFSLTYVEYPEGDFFGFILAIASLMPVAIVVGSFSLILFRRDLHTIAFLVGILVNELCNIILKSIIAEQRPLRRTALYTVYGMPSSHSQMICLHHNKNSCFDVLWKIVIGITIVLAACAVSYSRIYLLYHTWSQVVYGAIIGSFFGVGWFAVMHFKLTPVFPVIASWYISELLMIRDTSYIPNVLWFEYTNSRAENRARIRKLTSLKSQ